jgi:hypothetical protein
MVKVEVEKEWLKPQYWSLEDPHLYYLTTKISEGGQLVDEKSTRFGFREFWIDGKDFRLNGEIVRLRNFPVAAEGPAEMRPEYIRGWFALMKDKLHHNCIRFQAICPDIYADIADEAGLLIEDGTGFVGGDERARWNWPEANIQSKAEIGEWIRAKRNHPSIVIWSAENECWSMKSVKMYRDGDPEAIGIYKWLLGIRDWIKEHDDTRVITYHELGDMFDWTKCYFEENFEAGDLMGKIDNYNLHYPREMRFVAEEVELGYRWAKEKNKPLIIGEWGGPKTFLWCGDNVFEINGEECVGSFKAEGNANYYYFRRVVGAWRSAGMSGIYPWFPHYYTLKQSLGKHQFVWDDLTTPYFKPAHISYAAYNPGWDKSKPEYIPLGNIDPETDYRLWDMVADPLSPLLINLGGNYWEHNYLSGEKVTKQVSIVNDTPEAQEVTWSWVLEENGKHLAGDTKTLKLARSEIKKLSFDLPLPQVTGRTELTLRLTASAGSFTSKDSLDITVYPASSVLSPKFPQVKVALYDKVGKTAAILDKAGIPYEKLDKIVGVLKAKKHDVLIIGCDSADSSLTLTEGIGTVPILVKEYIKSFTESGGKVLVFEQDRDTYPNLNLIFPGIKAPAIEHFTPSYTTCTYADVAAPGHPIFQGLKKGVSLWKGEYGRVCEFSYPRPFGSRAIPLLFSGKWSTAIIEGFYGKGQYLLCQANLTTRYGQDPEATILMHNLLSYTLSTTPVTQSRAATVGEVGGLLGGFAADNLTDKLSAADLTKYEVLILGRETMTANSEAAGNSQKILKFAESGGTVFVLPQNPVNFKGDWLPGKINIRNMSTQYIFKEKTEAKLIWGVSAFDLALFYAYPLTGFVNIWSNPKVTAEFYGFSPDWTSLLLVSREPTNTVTSLWDEGGKGPIGGIFPTGGSALLQAKHGKGSIVLCQLELDTNCNSQPPGEDIELYNLGPRLAADTLLTNLGLTPGKGAGQDQGALSSFFTVDKDTVLLMHFDKKDADVVSDETSNGNHGKITGNADLTSDSGGKFGEGLKIPQAFGAVRVEDSKSLDITGAVTVECWIKPAISYPTTPPDWRGLVTKGYSNGESYGLSYLDSEGGKLQFAITDGVEKRYAASKVMNLKTDRWYHIAGTYDGNTMKLFVNGQNVASEVHKGSITPNDTPLWIGSGAPNTRNFIGVIDEVRISNRVRY